MNQRVFADFILIVLLTGCILPMDVAPTSTASPSTETSIANLDLAQMNVEEWASTSPDGKWVATGLLAFPNANSSSQLIYTRLMIFNTQENKRWRIIENWQELNLGFPRPEPLKWSLDSSHFYFTHRVIPDGCSVFDNFSDLQQVTLVDGTVKELLAPSALGLALSPDESKVAYIGYGERGLVIKDLTTNGEKEVKLDPGKGFEAGRLLWSPDGNSLVLTLAINPCTGEYGRSKTVWAESTSIFLVNPMNLEQRVLVQDDTRLFITLNWFDPDQVTITDGVENSLWKLNVETGEVTR